MADFKIQRGTAQIASGVSSITLTAGSDYDAPGSASSAFIRLTGHRILGSGMQADDTSGLLHRNSAVFTNPGNIVTSVTLANGSGTANYTVEYEWEIIEYIGAASGPNEFIVREVGVIQTSASSDLTETSAGGASATNDNDVVVFLTAQCQVGAGARTDYASALFTASWDGGTGTVTIARGIAGSGTNRLAAACYAVVEFTGSNWTVQRITHDQTATGTETETITDVGALTRAFIHIQSSNSYHTDPRHSGYEVWLSSTTQLSFDLDYAGSTRDFVVWVVSNSETGAGAMNVLRYSGSRASNTGANPDRWDETVTTVADLAATSIMGECCNVGSTANSDSHIAMLAFKLTADDTLRLNRGRDLAERDWRVEIVEWPAASSVVTLAPADAASASSADNVALTQHHALGVNDGASASSADNVALVQHHALTVADASAGSSAESVVLTEHAALTVADASAGSSAENIALTQHHALAVADAASASSADAVTLEVLLAVADAAAASSADNVTLTPTNALSVADAEAASSADAVALTQHNVLAVADAAAASSADNVDVAQSGTLAVADAGAASSAEAVALTQYHVLVVSDAVAASVADLVTLALVIAQHYVRAVLTFTAQVSAALTHRAQVDAGLVHTNETAGDLTHISQVDATLTHHTDDD